MAGRCHSGPQKSRPDSDHLFLLVDSAGLARPLGVPLADAPEPATTDRDTVIHIDLQQAATALHSDVALRDWVGLAV